jgi:hypothetical protein
MIHKVYYVIQNDTFILYLCTIKKKLKMPRRQLCQHPTLHKDSSYTSTGSRWIPSHHLKFICNRYDLKELNIRWLCPKCLKAETEMMNKEHGMLGEDDMNTSSDESCENGSINNEEEDDDGREIDNENDEHDSDERSSDDDMLYELTYRQEQAMEQLSADFELLKMGPIHDK